MRPPSRPHRLPPPPELPSDERLPIVLGTAAWFVLLLVGLVLRSRLDAEGRGWWLGCAAAGTLLGLYGLYTVQRRHAAAARGGRISRRTPPPGPPPAPRGPAAPG